MFREELIIRISDKLKKQEHMYRGYTKGSLDLRMLCDNLSLRVIREFEDFFRDNPDFKPDDLLLENVPNEFDETEPPFEEE